jgi:hypothetical protein
VSHFYRLENLVAEAYADAGHEFGTPQTSRGWKPGASPGSMV